MRSFYEVDTGRTFDSASLDRRRTRLQQLREIALRQTRPAHSACDCPVLTSLSLAGTTSSSPFLLGAQRTQTIAIGHHYLSSGYERGCLRTGKPRRHDRDRGTHSGDACGPAHRARFDLRRGQGIAAVEQRSARAKGVPRPREDHGFEGCGFCTGLATCVWSTLRLS